MTELTRLYLAIICNLIVFLVTAYIVASYFFVPTGKNHDGPPRGKRAFRFFTTDSNIFSALACGIAAAFELKNLCLCAPMFPHWVTLLKFYSAATVALTFLTVIFFLGPTQGYGIMLRGTSFHMHIAAPLLSVVSLCFLEDFDRISLEETLIGMIPMVVYAWIYVRQVILVAERDKDGNLIRGWEDFYGFNRGGHWSISAIVIVGAFAVVLFAVRAIYMA